MEKSGFPSDDDDCGDHDDEEPLSLSQRLSGSKRGIHATFGTTLKDMSWWRAFPLGGKLAENEASKERLHVMWQVLDADKRATLDAQMRD